MNDHAKEVENTEEGFTLLEFLQSIKNNLFLLIIIGIAFIGIGVFYTWGVVTPMYSATIGISVQPQDNSAIQNENQLVIVYGQVIEDIKLHVTTKDVLGRVLLNPEVNKVYSSPSQIAGRVSSRRAGNALSLYITYEDADPVLAQTIVVEIYNALEEKVNNGEIWLASKPKIKSFDIPKVPKVPSSPNKALNLIISALIGGIVGIVFVILKEQFSNKFSSKDEIEKTLGLPVFTLVPARVPERGVHNEKEKK